MRHERRINEHRADKLPALRSEFGCEGENMKVNCLLVDTSLIIMEAIQRASKNHAIRIFDLRYLLLEYADNSVCELTETEIIKIIDVFCFLADRGYLRFEKK